jgi:hypothetical protein
MLKVCQFAEHVGSVETLARHSVSMTNGDYSAKYPEGILAGLPQTIAVAEASDIDTTCTSEEVPQCPVLV